MRIIGIDPDVGKNGVAVVEDGRLTELHCLGLAELLGWLQAFGVSADAMVVVEAGWLNHRASWHVSPREGARLAAKKGHGVGRNHQRGMDIVEAARWLGCKVEELAPLRKRGHGADRKVSAAELERLTGWARRSNQEERDAAILALKFAEMRKNA